MLMGLPPTVDQRPTFHFADGRTFDPDDSAGAPYDWTTVPGGLPDKTPVQVVCAVETAPLTNKATGETAAGELNPGTALLYLFEDEWALVSDFTSVTMGGVAYHRVARLAPLGLFDVEIQVVEVRAAEVA